MFHVMSGVLLGLAIGFALPAAAANMVGANGYLIGWDVVFDGETICGDPYVWIGTREIECE